MVTVVLDGSYRICWTLDEWRRALREASESDDVGLDFETAPYLRYEDNSSALRAEFGASIAGIGVAWSTDSGIRSAYVGIRHDRRFAGGDQPPAIGATSLLSEFMEARPAGRTVVVANLAMELSFMLAENIVWPLPGQLHDVQIGARVLNKGVGFKELIGLKELQANILGRDMESKNDMDRWLIEHRFKPGQDIWRAPVPIAGHYCQDDARDTLAIFLPWKKLLHQPPTKWWWSRPPDRSLRLDLYEMEVEAAVHAIESCLRGARVDTALADRRATAARYLQEVTTRWVRAKMDVPTLNPGSMTQLRGLLFGSFGFKVSLAHLTDSFKKLPDKEQALILAGHRGNIIDYASLDVDALDHYASVYPEHADLMFVLAVYRKCQTALQWFDKNLSDFAARPAMDPWWGDDYELLNVIYHRLRTVGTVSGRMSASDFNFQQVPKRFKMLVDVERLVAIMAAFLPESQLEQLVGSFDIAHVAPGDEAKALSLNPGDRVIDLSARAMFIPRPGYRIRSFDLSQVEMRGFAHFSSNPKLCKGYGDPVSDARTSELLTRLQRSGYDHSIDVSDEEYAVVTADDAGGFDIHRFVADQLNISRKEAKAINFGIVYGMGKKKLARSMGWDLAKGKAYLDNYYREFPEINEIQDRIKVVLRERGYVFDPFGRRYYLPMAKSYVGLNRLIQGWAASVFKTGFVRTCELFQSPRFGGGPTHPITRRPTSIGSRVLSCIHDEQLDEVRKELDTRTYDWAVRTAMTTFHGLRVPLGTSSSGSDVSWDLA